MAIDVEPSEWRSQWEPCYECKIRGRPHCGQSTDNLARPIAINDGLRYHLISMPCENDTIFFPLKKKSQKCHIKRFLLTLISQNYQN